jgi:hypothetical protein
MTGRADFTEEEWDLLREVPETAGMIVISADRGGTFRETYALAKAYAEARQQHGASELLDEIVAAGPKRGERAHSTEQLREHGLSRVGEARTLLEQKGTPEELESYRGFVLTLTQKVAEAHKEGGEAVSERERAAIDEIESSLKGGEGQM